MTRYGKSQVNHLQTRRQYAYMTNKRKKVSETAWGENGVNTAKNVLYRLAFGQKALTIFQNAYDLPQTSMTVPHAELETWRFCLSEHFIGELILRGL